jgi:glycosyltransferase involved in cell wall biosynthesis
MIRKLCSVIKKEGIDIIHAHNYEGALIGYLAKILSGRPLLYNAVNNMIDELPGYNFIRPRIIAIWLSKFLDYWTPRTANFITVVSDELFSFLVEKGIDPEMIAVVPAGVNVDMFTVRDSEMVRQKYNIGSKPLVVYTGTLDAFQKVDYLLQALKEVVKENNEAILMIVANIVDELQLAKYQGQAEELGIAKNVIFTGEIPLSELPYFLAATDVVVIPRPSCPGFPVKLLNYMAAGKATVSFAGSAKGLWNMYNGIVVKDYDVDGLASGIIKLIRDPINRSILGKNARDSISGRFDWASLAERIELIYFKILREKNGQGIPTLSAECEQKIRKGYRLNCRERRQTNLPIKFADRRKKEKRVKMADIDFIERRKVE